MKTMKAVKYEVYKDGKLWMKDTAFYHTIESGEKQLREKWERHAGVKVVIIK